MNRNYRPHRTGSVSDKPLLAYLKDHVVRLASGTCCPNCRLTLRAIDTIIDFEDVGVVPWCWQQANRRLGSQTGGRRDDSFELDLERRLCPCLKTRSPTT
jgi:hypothetical protein